MFISKSFSTVNFKIKDWNDSRVKSEIKEPPIKDPSSGFIHGSGKRD